MDEGFIDSSLYLVTCPRVDVIKYLSEGEVFLIKVRCGKIYVNFNGSYEVIAKMVNDMQAGIEKVAPARTETTNTDIHTNIISDTSNDCKAVAI